MKHRSLLRRSLGKSLAALGIMAFGSTTGAPVEPAFAAPQGEAVPEGNLKFSIEMFRALGKQGQNLAFSPSSVESAFAIALAGAKGETASEIEKVFHLPPGGEDRFVLELQEQIARLGRSGTLQIATANGLWISTSVRIAADFIALAKEKFQAEVRPGDFVHNAEKVRVEINDWVLTKTHDKIRELIARNSLDAASIAIIVNAFYFKGDWQSQFKHDGTYSEKFHLEGGNAHDAPFMHQVSSFAYAESTDVQAVELPYVGGEVSMVIILPKENGGLKKLESSMSSATLSPLLQKLSATRVAIALPKFKNTTALNLAETLQSLGMKKAFIAKQADFTGIEATNQLYISDVIHQAFIQTDEKGTEAAAATAIEFVAGAAPMREELKTFKADHPFLYFLRERKTGAILMMGRVANPA